MVAVHAEFDQYLNEPVLMPSFTYCGIGLPAIYHHQLQETLHISLPFATTGPGTESTGPSRINYWIGLVQFFVDRSNSNIMLYKTSHTIFFKKGRVTLFRGSHLHYKVTQHIPSAAIIGGRPSARGLATANIHNSQGSVQLITKWCSPWETKAVISTCTPTLAAYLITIWPSWYPLFCDFRIQGLSMTTIHIQKDIPAHC